MAPERGDIQARTSGDKVDFFRRDKWREAWPQDYRRLTPQEVTEDMERRRNAVRANMGLSPMCFVCKKEIPPTVGDRLVINTDTGARGLAHLDCHFKTSVVHKVTTRHCVGGQEIEGEDQ